MSVWRRFIWLKENFFSSLCYKKDQQRFTFFVWNKQNILSLLYHDNTDFLVTFEHLLHRIESNYESKVVLGDSHEGFACLWCQPGNLSSTAKHAQGTWPDSYGTVDWVLLCAGLNTHQVSMVSPAILLWSSGLTKCSHGGKGNHQSRLKKLMWHRANYWKTIKSQITACSLYNLLILLNVYIIIIPEDIV